MVLLSFYNIKTIITKYGNEQVNMIFLEFSKAFDKMPHKRLPVMSKLYFKAMKLWDTRQYP